MLSRLRNAKAKAFAEESAPADPAKVAIPPYYPDHPVVREDWAQYLDACRYTDKQVGEIVDRLAKASALGVDQQRRVAGLPVVGVLGDGAGLGDQASIDTVDVNGSAIYQVNLTEDQAVINRVLEGESDLSFDVSYEVLPPVKLMDFKGMALPTMPWLVIQGEADEIVDPQGDPSDPANWRASAFIGGSPGSTAGGLKTTTAALMAPTSSKECWRTMR